MTNEAKLSELVGQAQFKRAITRATQAAQKTGVLVYVYRTRRGFAYDVARPQVENAWRVGPAGTVTEVSSGESR